MDGSASAAALPGPRGIACSGVLVILHNGVGFELDQPIRINEPRHLHDRVRGADLTKELAVNHSDGLPVVDVYQKSPMNG